MELRVRRAAGILAAMVLLWTMQSSTPAMAQGAAHLAGVVHTAEGVPIPAATVRAEDLSSHRAWVSWTDANGRYEFPALPPGQYEVSATMLGFAPGKQQAGVSGSTTLDLTLNVATLAELSSGPESGSRAEAANGPAGEAQPTKPAVGGKRVPTETAAGKAAGAAAGAEAKSRQGAGPTGQESGRGRAESEGRGPRGAANAGVMNAIRAGMGGFQQVDVSGEAGAEQASGMAGQGEQTQVAAGSGQAGAGQGAAAMTVSSPLGEASSSDSFLMNGSVGQSVGTLPGANLGFGGPGGPGGPGMMGGGFPGGEGGPGGSGPRGGPGGGRFVRGRPGGPGGPRRFRGPAPASSVAELYQRQRFLSRSVNRIRFNFFNTYENSVWDARPYSLNQATPPKISHYNDRFGGSMGGPLYLPHMYDGRDRTFFFVNYNFDRQESPKDEFLTVPTVAERAGNFCDRHAQLFDPYSSSTGPRTPLGCQLPGSMVDSAAQGLLKYIPEPNLPGLVQNYHLQEVLPQSTNFVNAHLLHTINARYNVSGGYNFESSHVDTLADFPTLPGTTQTRNQNVTLALNQNWTPRLVNSTSLNFNRSRISVLSDNSYGTDIAAALGITGVSASPIDFGVPQINFTNFGNLSDPIPSLSRNQTWRFDDGVTFSLTNHTITAGFELRRMDWNKYGDPTPRGQFIFNGQLTSQLDTQGRPVAGTGLDFADFLVGLPYSTYLRYGSIASYFRSWGYAAYAQDDWRIQPRFSLSYGLRYDFVTPATELFNAISNLDLSPGITAAAQVVPGQAGPFSGALPQSLVRSDPNNFGPRIGFAWQPFGSDPMIVRGGYSIFYNESIYQQLAFEMANQPPFAQAQTRLTNPTAPLTLENGFPAAALAAAENTYAVDPNYQAGYAQIWDLSIERQLRGGWVVDVYYTGTKGTHLDMQMAPHSAPPGTPISTPSSGPNGFIYDTSGASSIYHAMHATVRKRPTHGLMLIADYALGKSIDNASTIGGGTPTVVQDDNDFRAERGLSSFDVRNQIRGFFFYQLPFGPRQRWARGGWKERVFGNFRLNGVVTANSGTPFTARVLGAATNNTATGANFSLRANQIGSGCSGGAGVSPFFNPAAFVAPPAGQYGDAARNTICGPGMANLNLGLDRGFVFGKDQTHRLDLRWEVQNLTNTPHYTSIQTAVNSSTYGLPLAVGNMRTMDLTMRVSF